MTNDKAISNGAEKTTLNISLTAEDKKFLKVYAAQNGTTISSMIQGFIETLKSEQTDKPNK